MDDATMPQFLLLDNDGVLVDSERLYFAANRSVLAEHGVDLDEDTFADLSLRQGIGVFHLVPGLDHADQEQLRAERNRRYHQLLTEAGDLVLPGVRETLATLAGRYRLAVVTSSRKDHFAAIHRHSGILDHVEFVLANGDYPHTKPAPDPYLAALHRFAAAPIDCVVVEDTPRGLASATAAGIRCIVQPSPFLTAADFPGATAFIDRFADLPSAIAALS